MAVVCNQLRWLETLIQNNSKRSPNTPSQILGVVIVYSDLVEEKTGHFGKLYSFGPNLKCERLSNKPHKGELLQPY